MGKKKQPAKSPVLPPPVSDERYHVRVVLALCLLGFTIYANTFAASFHFDDLLVIVNNPAIRHLNLADIFSAFNTRFLTGLTFAVNYRLGGLDVFGYHFFNIWLHVCNAVLVYTFVLLLLNARKIENAQTKVWTAAAAAFLFLAHPMQTQAVNYIWQRTTLLAAFFYILSAVLYLQARLSGSRAYYCGAVAACFFAMFCKEIAFTLPVLILILEWLVLKTRRIFYAAPFLVMFLIIPALVGRSAQATLPIMHSQGITRAVSESVMPAHEYWLTEVNALAAYLKFFVWPSGQSIDHDFPLTSESGWGIWILSLGALILLMGTGIYFFRPRPHITFGILWFFLTISIESLVVGAEPFVEHRLYLPMVGLATALAVAVSQALNRKTLQMFFVIVLVTMSALTFSRNKVWINDLELWSDAIQKAPNKARAYNNRGIVYKKINFADLALRDFNRAIEINPDYPEAIYNRGGIYKMKGDLALAERDYARVIELEPTKTESFDARGYILRRQGRYNEALKDFESSIALNPRNPEVYNNRAYIYQKQGRRDLAIADYSRAIDADPGYIYAYNNRGNLYLEEEKLELAVADYTQAIGLQPDFGEPYVNRAVAEFQQGRISESRNDIKRARELKMKINPEFLRQLNDVKE